MACYHHLCVAAGPSLPRTGLIGSDLTVSRFIVQPLLLCPDRDQVWAHPQQRPFTFNETLLGDQSTEQQRDGLTGRQEQAMGTLRCRRGLPYEAKSLHSREERQYHVRVGVPNWKFWLKHSVAGAGVVSMQGVRDASTGSRPSRWANGQCWCRSLAALFRSRSLIPDCTPV